jgi:hypothetical protein
MSVDNIAHLGSQGLDELVPSRYALPPITGKTIAYNADSADLASWLDDMFLPPDVLEWPLNVAVVRSGDRTILIDAGSAGRSRSRGWIAVWVSSSWYSRPT